MASHDTIYATAMLRCLMLGSSGVRTLLFASVHIGSQVLRNLPLSKNKNPFQKSGSTPEACINPIPWCTPIVAAIIDAGDATAISRQIHSLSQSLCADKRPLAAADKTLITRPFRHFEPVITWFRWWAIVLDLTMRKLITPLDAWSVKSGFLVQHPEVRFPRCWHFNSLVADSVGFSYSKSKAQFTLKCWSICVQILNLACVLCEHAI